jgi:cold shock CspA family protein
VLDRDGYLHQQRAIYEMKRHNPNFERAYKFLAKARDELPYDKSITHSLAELELLRAQASRTEVERDRHLLQAKNLAVKLTGSNSDSSHGYATLVKLELEKFRGLLRDGSSTDEELAAGAKAVEQALSNGLAQFHLDEHLLTFEAEFSQLLHNENRAMKALQKANQTNPASQYVAKSFSRLLEKNNDFEGARRVLMQVLNTLPGDKGVNASLARLIDDHYPDEAMESEACWRRSFTKGDTNYTSQYFFARRLWLNDKFDEAKDIFQTLKLARVSRDVKTEISGWIIDGANMKKFSGTVYRKESDYAWITPSGQSRAIFLHCSNVNSEDWARIVPGNNVTFAIGFNYMGPAASMRLLAPVVA